MATMRQIEEMEQKEKAIKAGPCFIQLEGGHGNEKVGEKRRFRDACDAGGEGIGQRLRGEGGVAGGEKLQNKSNKEAKRKQGSFQRKIKEKAVEKRKRHLSEEDNEVVGKRRSGEKKRIDIYEHNRIKSGCKQCGGSSICQHNRQKSGCKQCGGSSICKHNRERRKCKQCGGSSICEHNRRRSQCKQCGGSSICEQNRERRKCKQCGGSSICEHNPEEAGASNAAGRASVSTTA